MAREYRTIQEVAGPLMLVEDVTDVKYDELGEIELANGEIRRCKVLEVNGTNALVQLFENAMGINVSSSAVRFLGRGLQVGLSPDILGRTFDGMGTPIDGQGPIGLEPWILAFFQKTPITGKIRLVHSGPQATDFLGIPVILQGLGNSFVNPVGTKFPP